MIDKILDLLTSEEVLNSKEFIKAYPILPENFKDFEELLKWKDYVKNLILLPIKSDEMRAFYKEQDKNILAKDILSNFNDSDIIYKLNEFPYMTPDGTRQYIIWIKDKNMSRIDIAKFILKISIELKINLDKTILFERPLNIENKLIKGTFPQIKHIHLWTSML